MLACLSQLLVPARGIPMFQRPRRCTTIRLWRDHPFGVIVRQIVLPPREMSKMTEKDHVRADSVQAGPRSPEGKAARALHKDIRIVLVFRGITWEEDYQAFGLRVPAKCVWRFVCLS